MHALSLIDHNTNGGQTTTGGPFVVSMPLVIGNFQPQWLYIHIDV